MGSNALVGFKYLGDINGNVFYWWNNETQILAKTGNDHKFEYTRLGLHDVSKLIPLNKDSTLLLSELETDVIDNKTLKRTVLRYGRENDNFAAGPNELYTNKNIGGAMDGLVRENKTYYFISGPWVFTLSKRTVPAPGFCSQIEPATGR